MKNFTIRTISATVFVIIIIGSALLNKYVFFSVFAIISGLSVLEFYNLTKKGGINPQVISGIIVSTIIYVSIFLYIQKVADLKIFLILIPSFLLIPIVEIFRKKENKIPNLIYTLIGIFYFSVPFGLLNSIISPSIDSGIYKPEIMIGLFAIIWINDAGAYIFGKLLGKHKMAEKISPNKTWEGAIGGAIASIALSIVYFKLFNLFNPFIVIIMSLTTVIAGTVGDLTESLFKRYFNVKDSGNIMPGHGGFFDRFDSLIFAAPVYFLFIHLFLK